MLPKVLFLFVLVVKTLVVQVNSEGCLIEDHPLEECPETEYQAYINCLQQKRVKRSVCNDEPCQECNCSYCQSNECSELCNNCCEISFETCDTAYCCYKRCHSQCHSGECRKNCRKTCQDNIDEKKVHVKERSNPPNVTTIINLNNQINNTNIVDIPITINNTNLNNHVIAQSEMPKEEAMSDSPATEAPKESEKNCCQVISPRQCVPQSEFPFIKCFRYRQKICGSICKAPIMYSQTHQVCDENPSGPPKCHNQIIYIPQPQPKCTYSDTWPYVSCNVENMANTYFGPYNYPYSQYPNAQFPYGQYSYGQYPYGQYPYGQNPYSQYPYQPYFGYNFAPYYMQRNPFIGAQNYYGIAKDVGQNPTITQEGPVDKEMMDFAAGSDISETIPIENYKANLKEPVDATLVKVKVENKPSTTLTIKQVEDNNV